MDDRKNTTRIRRLDETDFRLSAKPIPKYARGSRSDDHHERKILEPERSARSVKRRIQKAYAKRLKQKRMTILIALLILVIILLWLLIAL